MYSICIVQRFEPQGRCFINFLYYHYICVRMILPASGHAISCIIKVLLLLLLLFLRSARFRRTL